MHLSVLDDDQHIATFIANVARERAYTVDVTLNEADFRKCFRERRPDAVMLDLQLGFSDGIEQLRFLHAEKFRGPLVVMSGFDARVLHSAQELGRSLGLSIVTTLEKPIRAAILREALDLLDREIGSVLARVPEPASHRPSPTAVDFIDAREIDQALRAHQFALYLQPIVSAADFALDHLEGLARWRHPLLGIVTPDRFIPAAERDPATIDRFTMWVIEAAIEHSKRLAAAGYKTRIAVNVSGMDLRALDFPDRVAALVARCGGEPSSLAVEVTETVAMRDPGATGDILSRLRLKGIALSLDDFGTGNSSLVALRTMPFGELKIDKSFVMDMLRSHDSLTIVKSVIDLARNLGLTAVAEGVESEEIARRLIGLGCQKLQGYYFSRPLPIDELIAWLGTRPRPSPSLAQS
jgi:EAL domain-containing protein (putative c-di-GMP-specific phosphodiesterase class I)/ActR/RegA family two-component response regulator